MVLGIDFDGYMGIGTKPTTMILTKTWIFISLIWQWHLTHLTLILVIVAIKQFRGAIGFLLRSRRFHLCLKLYDWCSKRWRKSDLKWNMQEKFNSFSWKLGRFFGFIVIFLLSNAFCTYKCYTYSESYGSKKHSGNITFSSWVEMKTPGILSSLRTQTGPWSDTIS